MLAEFIRIWLAFLALSALFCSEFALADVKPDFDRDIAPLFQARCVKCHGPARQEGKLDLSTAVGVARGGESGAAFIAGELNRSEIWVRVASGEMPPDNPLPDNEQALVKAWISGGSAGLPSPDHLGMSLTTHWSFRKLQSVEVPTVSDESLCRNDIDRFLQAELEAHGLGLGGAVERTTLIRRVSFDLTGLPPTVEQVKEFVTDARDNAYSHMVERYLSSPQFGVRWGKYWLDVAGYADSEGYFDSDRVRPHAYRYRDYVIRSICKDKPFDQFICEQLAGDELMRPDALAKPTTRDIELLEATHFLRNAEDGTGESNGNPTVVQQDRQAVLDAVTEIFGSVLFGMSLQCARCHDHKFEPVTQREYYGLQAVLAPAFNIQNWVAPTDRYVIAATPQETAEFKSAIKKGSVTPADCPGKIMATRDVSPVPPEVFILERGEIAARGDKVSPTGLAALTDPDNEFAIQPRQVTSHSTGYRLAFARWLTRPGSRPAALLARLHVNRIWQQYFGTGLVATPSNFGYSGQRPSHPELLDWLADQLVSSGWSSKFVHRLIVQSAAYRQSCGFNPDAYQVDPDNRLLWRMPLKRLDAEQIYDAMLAVGGELDLHMGGPATETVRRSNGEVAAIEVLPGGKRRAVYLLQRRTQIPTILQVFDAPSLVTNCVQRLPSTVPQQSLALLNSDFTLARVEHLARRLAMDSDSSLYERIVRTFMLVLAREPDSEELRASLQFIQNQTRHYMEVSREPQLSAWTDFCHALISSNAFLYVN